MSEHETRRGVAIRPGFALWRTGLGPAPIVYDDAKRRPTPQLQARDMEIMQALWRYTFLTTGQIGDTWWQGRHPSRPQIRLTELTGAGLLARFRPLVKRGTHQWIYQLARDGFRAAQRAVGPHGVYIDEREHWTDRRAADMRSVEHILRLNGWMLAYGALLGDRLLDWRGPREASADAGGEESVAPDASVVVDVDAASPPLELLIELARDERPVRLTERLRRYDAMLSTGWRSVPRFEPAAPPAAVFVAPGYREVDRLLRLADAAVARARSRIMVCAEPDVHRADPRGWMLPTETPGRRGSDDFTAIEVELPV